MKKTLLLIFVISSLSSFARMGKDLKSGTSFLNVGVGVLSNYGPKSYNTILPPIGISYDYTITNNFTLGLYGGTTMKRFKFEDGYQMGVNYYIVGLRPCYHFQKFIFASPRLDPYIGAIVGYNFAIENDPQHRRLSSSLNYGGNKLDKPLGGLFVGARYFMTKSTGLFLEAGLGIAVFTGGITFKF